MTVAVALDLHAEILAFAADASRGRMPPDRRRNLRRKAARAMPAIAADAIVPPPAGSRAEALADLQAALDQCAAVGVRPRDLMECRYQGFCLSTIAER
jgi:hypothetical protein